MFRGATLEPVFFARIYAVLFTLYILNTEEPNEIYQRYINVLNELPDPLLFQKIGIPRKYWLREQKSEGGASLPDGYQDQLATSPLATNPLATNPVATNPVADLLLSPIDHVVSPIDHVAPFTTSTTESIPINTENHFASDSTHTIFIPNSSSPSPVIVSLVDRLLFNPDTPDTDSILAGIGGVSCPEAGHESPAPIMTSSTPTMIKKDNGASEKDNGASENDNGASKNDNGARKNDNGTSKKDNGASKKDNGASEKDNGASKKDNGASKKDNGASEKDNGASKEDNGASKKDNGTSKKDNGTSKKGTECEGYRGAILTLRKISGVFSPEEKLGVLLATFVHIREAVASFWGCQVLPYPGV